MNCDDAFDLLTDPEQRPSALLEQHLDHCPRCRQMRETLAPALADLHAEPFLSPFAADGRLAEDVARTAGPCFLSVEAVEVAERAARQLAARTPRCRPPLRRFVGAAARYAAVFLVGAMMAFGTVSGEPDHSAPRHLLTAVPQVASCTRNLVANLDVGHTVDARHVVMSCVACHLAAR